MVLGLQMGASLDSINQEIKYNMLAASAIENLCYAYIHRSNYMKYIKRVEDAMKKAESRSYTIPEITTDIFNCIKSNLRILRPYNNIIFQNILVRLLGITSGQSGGYQGGGMLKLKKMKNKEGVIIKKYINEKERVIYVDNTRKQYVKHKNAYIPISKFRAMMKKH